jgi:hypothetical protein
MLPFIFDPLQKLLEMMNHPIENCAFRMTRTVDSRHIRKERSRNGPGKGLVRESGDSDKKCREARSIKRGRDYFLIAAASP